MPFKSEKQRRYLWANEPEIARDWSDTYGSKIQKAKGGVMNVPRRRYFSGAYGQGAGDRGGDPRASASENIAAGRAEGPAWSPGVGGTQHIPRPKKTITKDVRPTITGGASPFGYTRFARPITPTTKGITGSNAFKRYLWEKGRQGLQLITQQPRFAPVWDKAKYLKEGMMDIYSGTSDKALKAFEKIRPTKKFPPTTDDFIKALQGKLGLGQSEGVHFSPSKVTAKGYAAPFKWSDPSTWGRGSRFATGEGKLLEGKIPAKFADLTRNMYGQIQGIIPSELANKAYFGKNVDLSALKSVARPASKLLGRAMPWLGAGIGGVDATMRFKEGDWLGGALSAGSMVPFAGLAPLGVQMLTDKFGLTGVNRDIGRLDTQLSENAMQPAFGAKQGGIARLPFAKGGRRDIEGSGYYDAPQGRQELRSMQANINQAQRNGGYNWGAKGEDPVVISSKDLEFINQRDGKSKQWTWDRTSLMNQKTRDIIKMLRLETPKMGYYDRYTFPSGFYEEQEDGEFTSGYLKGPATWGINPAWTGEGPDIRKYPYAKGGLATLWQR